MDMWGQQPPIKAAWIRACAYAYLYSYLVHARTQYMQCMIIDHVKCDHRPRPRNELWVST